MIISIDAEKAFDKTQHPFTNVILNSQKLQAFPLRSGTRQGRPLSPLLFNIVPKVLVTPIRQEGEIQGIQIGEEEVKLSLYVDGMIQYIENPKDSIKTLLAKTYKFQYISKIQN